MTRKKKELPQAQILKFPEDRIVRNISVAGFQDLLYDAKLDYIHYLVDKHVDAMFNRLKVDGVEIEDPRGVADTVFVYEAVKSMLYRMHDIQHPLQEFVDKNVTDGVVQILGNISNHYDDGYEDDEGPEDPSGGEAA